MRKRDKDQTGRKAKEDHEMAGVQGWVPSRAGPGGAAEGMRGTPPASGTSWLSSFALSSSPVF